jgi:hypothetical protein
MNDAHLCGAHCFVLFWQGRVLLLRYFCKKKMRSYSVLIDYPELCEVVYRITANAAKERGDALHVATEEDKDLIEGFFSAAMPALRTAFGKYLTGGSISYSMPENWSNDELTVGYCCTEYLVDVALARWFEMSGVANAYMNAARGAIEALVLCLNKRKKPIR